MNYMNLIWKFSVDGEVCCKWVVKWDSIGIIFLKLD